MLDTAWATARVVTRASSRLKRSELPRLTTEACGACLQGGLGHGGSHRGVRVPRDGAHQVVAGGERQKLWRNSRLLRVSVWRLTRGRVLPGGVQLPEHRGRPVDRHRCAQAPSSPPHPTLAADWLVSIIDQQPVCTAELLHRSRVHTRQCGCGKSSC
jgi:hypothetical protein